MRRLFIAGSVILLLLLNTLILIGPMMLIALLKLVLPGKALRTACSRGVMWVAETWAEIDKLIFATLTPTVWDIRGGEGLRRDRSYLVVSNHQSWVDIPALVQAFNRKTPYFKFFLKQELIWVPFLGLAFWALDYPFMKRYSKAYLARHPEMAGQDLEITKRACARFKDLNVTVVNYLEGTRFTAAKQAQQGSPYQHLLKPKAGALALSLHAMGEKFDSLIDVTIVYPHGRPTFWQFMCGRVPEIVMRVHRRPIPPAFCHGDYSADAAFRAQIHGWLADLWAEKDAEIERLLAERRDPA